MANFTQVQFLTDVHALGGHGSGAAATGGRLETLLPTLSGEILTAYHDQLMFRDKVRTLPTLAGGVHRDFPLLWKIGSEIHQAGEELLGTDVTTGRRRITLDDRPRVAHFEIDNIDELLAQYSVRSELAAEMGHELATQTDADIAKLIILAARASDTTVFPAGGGRIAVSTTATGVLDAIDTAVVTWDTNNFPDRNRYCAVDPGRWHSIRDIARIGTAAVTAADTAPHFQNSTPVTGQPGGPGGPNIAADAGWDEFILYKGFKIFRSTNIPSTDLSTASFRPGDFTANSGTVGMIWSPDCIGFLEGMGMMTEVEHSVRHGADFMVAKTLIGGGSLRMEAAVELTVA